MATYISMLRGINVSGQKKIRMEELQALYESLNLKKVETYIQSGNVIFDSPKLDALEVSKLIEEEIEQVYNFSLAVFIRTRKDFQRIIQNNPFLTGRKEDIARLYVTFLSQAPTEAAVDELKTPGNDPSEFYIFNKEIYLFCPIGYGTTKLSNNFFERKLAVTATTRNWKTVNRLYDMAGGK